MSALAFDTHAYVKKLEAAGFTEQQAEVLAETQADLINDRLASKLDIENLRSDIENLRLASKLDIENLRLASKLDIENLRSDIENLRLASKLDVENLHSDIENLRLASKLDVENLHSDIENLRLASKLDIENLRLATQRDLKELELRLEAKQAETKAEIIRWTVGAGLFQTALIAALLLKLVH